MSSFGGMYLTNKGKNLLAKAQAGAKVQFTRVGVGSGQLGSNIIKELNGLITQEKSLSILKLKATSNGKAVIGFKLSNQSIITGFYFREIGLFAQDPDEGEILYCYANCGATAEYIAAGGGADIIEKSIDLITIIGDSANFTATIDNSLVYALKSELDEAQRLLSDTIHTIPIISISKSEPLNRKINDIWINTI